MVSKSEPEIRESRRMAANKFGNEEISTRTLEVILDAKLDPLIHAIERLEKSQEKMVDILQRQAVQDIRIEHIEEALSAHVIRDEATQEDLYKRLRNTELKWYDRVWDLLKIGLAVSAGGIITYLIRR